MHRGRRLHGGAVRRSRVEPRPPRRHARSLTAPRRGDQRVLHSRRVARGAGRGGPAPRDGLLRPAQGHHKASRRPAPVPPVLRDDALGAGGVRQGRAQGPAGHQAGRGDEGITRPETILRGDAAG